MREWLKTLPAHERLAIGEDIKAVQFRWPLGMPLVRKLSGKVWEVRTQLPTRIARVLFTTRGERNGVVTRFYQEDASHRTPRYCAGTKPNRLLEKVPLMPIGSNFDDFLKEEGLYELSTAAAIKKVLALQIEEAMKAQQLTKTAMAKRMHTSRAALNRLLDNTDTSLTLTTLASAAAALGKDVRVELIPAG